MDILKYRGDALLYRNAGLLQCCCGSPEGLFWEGIPCPLSTDPKGGCLEWETCQYPSRIFITQGSYCDGATVTICECQRLRIFGFTNFLAEGSNYTNVLTFTWNGDSGTTGTVTVTTTQLIVSATSYPDIVFDLADYTTTSSLLTDLANATLTTHGNKWTLNSSHDINPRGFAPTTFTLNPFETDSVDSVPAGFYLKYNGNTGIFVASSTDMDVVTENVETALGVFVAVRAVKNEFYSGGSELWIDIKFEGADCGLPQPHIELDYSVIDNSTFEFHYGDDSRYSYFDPYAGTDKLYFVVGNNTPCPLETNANDGPFTYPDAGCCPQRGTTLGGYQFAVDSTGYFAGEAWANLENTIKYGDGCFSVSPGFFVAGMEGRLSYNQPFDKELHIIPDCGISGPCQDDTPTNCVRELFLPTFHKNVPWGPFGAYFPGLEAEIHPAWTSPYNTNANPLTSGFPAFLSSGVPEPDARVGYSYRPYATVKTRGSWLQTEQIEVYGRVYKPIPYHVGDLPFDDASGTISFEPSTIDAGFTVTYPNGEGCGPFKIVFNCSGKTVGNFVDAINALRIRDFDNSCPVFDFCAAGTDARDTPANKIINVSSEIADYAIHGYDGIVGTPDDDDFILSGATVVMPKGYQYYFGGSVWNRTRYLNYTLDNKVVTYYWEPLLPSYNEAAQSPPECRLTRRYLPKDGNNPGFIQEGNKHWFTNIPTSRQDVLAVGINRDVDPTGYPNWSVAHIEVTGTIVNYYASGLALCTGFIDTNKSGSGYLHNDFAAELSSVSFTWASGTFNPFVASGIGPYNIWLDDQTSISGSTYTYDTISPTTYNYSYKEPLLSQESTDILNSSGYLQSLVRRRCSYGDAIEPTGEPILQYCVSSEAALINSASVYCDGDDFIVGSWVLGYGCLSSNCVTRWYYQSERCSCDTVQRCGPNATYTEYPHPFNQPRNGLNNAYWDDHGWSGYTVSQPTVYICEHNFNPDCDIPMMVKVPFQVVAPDGSIDYQVGLSNDLPGRAEFCNPDSDTSIAISNAYGWCQYIDPSSATLVSEEAIPRTDPPTAYVIERTAGSFCSTNPWNYNPDAVAPGAVATAVNLGATYMGLPDGCSLDSEACTFGCASCNWDRMCNIYALGDDYLIRYSDPEYLCVLFRPIVKNLERGDVCEGSGADRLDIDCSTTCCECGFTCSTEGGPADQLVGNGWTQTWSYTHDFHLETPAGCAVINVTACAYLGCCIVDQNNLPPCTEPDGYCLGPPCIAGGGAISQDFGITLSGTSNHCACFTDTTCGTTDVTVSVDCSGDPPCTGTVLVAPEAPSGTTICYDCTNLYFPDNTPYSDSFSSTDVEQCGNCGSRGEYSVLLDSTDSVSVTGSNTSNSCTGAIGYSYSFASGGSRTYHGDNSCTGPVTFTFSNTESVTYTLSARSWKTCSVSTPDGQPYSYIKNWLTTTLWDCTNKNLLLSVNGTDDRNYFGNNCGV